MERIRIANQSRRNRMFFDNLIKEVAICINVGYTSLNRDLELPSYRGINRRGEEGVIDMGSNHQAIGIDTPRAMLAARTLDALDRLLAQAAEEGLTGCNSRHAISRYIMSRTDLTDCHLCALNEMTSIW